MRPRRHLNAAPAPHRHPGGRRRRAPTGRQVQYEADHGPGLDAIRHHDTALVDDLALDQKWPRFSTRAAEETGVRSMLSFRLFVQEDTMGALNLCSKQKAAFDDHAVEVGSVFAAHAAVALAHARTEEQAFDMLRRASQRLNVKLSDVAVELANRLEGEWRTS